MGEDAEVKGYWKHTTSDTNEDMFWCDGERVNLVELADYLRVVEWWEDPLPLPPLQKYGDRLVYNDGAVAEFGTKQRAGDAFVQDIIGKAPDVRGFCYVQTIGKAAPALTTLTKKYGKGMVIFCPASKETTDDQRLAIELGAHAVFMRIAAMKQLRAVADRWAARNLCVHAPLGLHATMVTAAIVKTAVALKERDGEPEEVWTVMGSGVLSRALQIAWPNAKFFGVPVSRNIKDGEKGRAVLHPYPQDFEKGLIKGDECWLPRELDTIDTYDGKGYVQFNKMAGKNAVFWNVAGKSKPKDLISPELVESAPDWETVLTYDPTDHHQDEFWKQEWTDSFA